MSRKQMEFEMVEHFNYDRAACQAALMIVRSIELPSKGGDAQCESSAGATS